MLVKVDAYHSKGEYHRDAICGMGNDLPTTHCLIATTTFEVDETIDCLEEGICGLAFHKFNWMSDERYGLAPDEVNARAREFDSHASMSVGDVVVIHSSGVISAWKCENFGWERVFTLDTNQAGIPEV